LVQSPDSVLYALNNIPQFHHAHPPHHHDGALFNHAHHAHHAHHTAVTVHVKFHIYARMYINPQLDPAHPPQPQDAVHEV